MAAQTPAIVRDRSMAREDRINMAWLAIMAFFRPSTSAAMPEGISPHRLTA